MVCVFSISKMIMEPRGCFGCFKPRFLERHNKPEIKSENIKSQKVEKKEEDEDEALDFDILRIGLRRYSFAEIEEITKGFSEVIGVGGFATVYKGVLPDGSEVAVKLLKASTYKKKEFLSEITILARIHHKNLIDLRGYSTERSHRILVYEYMVNGTLADWIFCDPSSRLNWKIRFEIIVGMTQGMAYLHSGCKDKILHLDLKPQNILLDAKFRPRVADFGLSKLMDREKSMAMTNNIKGTPGYIAPDWMEGRVSEKTDIYSYGIVLLEILGGKRTSDLSKWRELSNAGEEDEEYFKEMIDDTIQETIDRRQAKRVVRIALICVEHDPAKRPSMAEVLQMLDGLIPIPYVGASKPRQSFMVRSSDGETTDVTTVSSTTVNTATTVSSAGSSNTSDRHLDINPWLARIISRPREPVICKPLKKI